VGRSIWARIKQLNILVYQFPRFISVPSHWIRQPSITQNSIISKLKEFYLSKMSGPIDIIAIITPAPGKADRVEQLLSETAQWVKANEPGTLRYHLQRETSGDSPAFVMLET
jgi:hypothetical protein